jgi:hypothetical protein
MVTDTVVSENADTECTNNVIEDKGIGHLCCEKLELELNKVTMELKSAEEVIEIVKEVLGITDKTVNEQGTISYDCNRGILSTLSNENWNHIKGHLNRKKVNKTTKIPSTKVSTANHFEVLYNLKDSTSQIEIRKKKPTTSNVISQDSKTKVIPSTRAHNSKNNGKDQEVHNIPVVINGIISSSKRDEVLTSDFSVLNNGDRVNGTLLKTDEDKYAVNKMDVSVLNLPE